MNKTILVFCVSFLVVGTLVLSLDFSHLWALNKRDLPVSAAIDVRTIVSFEAAQSQKPGIYDVQLALDETIPLDCIDEGAYLGSLKFDTRGSIYLSASLPDRKFTSLIKLDPEQKQCQYISIPASNNGQLVAFDIGRDEIIYGALQFPTRTGAIILMNSSGDLISQIDTGNYLPCNITIDSQRRIWTMGQLLNFTAFGPTLEDVQLRAYEPNGKSISVLAGGFDVIDSGMSALLPSDDGVRCFSYASAKLYEFKDNNGVDALNYPFHFSTDLYRSASNPILDDKKRFIKGIVSAGNFKVWYGSIEDSERRGFFPKSFIGLTSLTGETLSSEIELPSEYRSIAGVDTAGNLYIFSKENEKLVIKKLKMVVSH